ncbi:hypothetical protein UlMin_005900 [Ulmus minor]
MATDAVPQDHRKRSLAALERRFAAAKAEVDLQSKKINRLNEEDGKEVKSRSSSTVDVSTATPSKKDADIKEPVYSKLSQTVHENLLTANSQISSRKESSVVRILNDLLQKGDSRQKYMQGSRSKKPDNWILLDNYVQGRSVTSGSRIRALQMHSKRSKKHMSMKQHKKHGSLNLPQEQHKFENFRPMHEMWKDYMTKILKSSGKNQLAQCLLDADLHGAIISVAECKIIAFAGVSGIMIRETAETFGIITHDDKFRVVPKKASVFIFQVDCWKITLHGDKLTSRNVSLTQ